MDENNVCSICERGVAPSRGPIPFYFCKKCFAEHRAAIDNKEPWLMFLYNSEYQRRRNRNKQNKSGVSLVSLDELRGEL